MSNVVEMRRDRSAWEMMLGFTESPIERAFLDAFCSLATAPMFGYRVWKTPRGNTTIAIRPQQRVGRHRVDFSIAFRFFKSEIALVVECDGHEFHERTKEQAARDRARDRFLAAQGYRLLRFTGAELHADAQRCARETLDIILNFQTACCEAAPRGPTLERRAG